MATYTVYQVLLNGNLYSKEHLNNREELADWVDNAMGKYAHIRVENDHTGEVREFQDYAGSWDRIS